MKKIYFLFVVVFISISTYGAYLRNVPVSVTQPDGAILQCFVTGDEFHRRLHDADNYTIVLDSGSGYYVYAEYRNSKLEPTTYIAGKVIPSEVGLTPGADLPSAEIENIRNTFVKKYMNLPLPVAYKSLKATGTMNNIVLFIRFNNDSEFSDNISTYNNFFNNAEQGASSMQNYFKEVSYNTLTIQSSFFPIMQTTVVSYQDSHNRNYYQPYNQNTNTNGYSNDDERKQREHTLLKNAVEAIAPQISPSLDIDYNNDGYVDNVCFIIKGNVDAWADLLWPHRWSLYSENAYINGKRVWDYNFQLQQNLQTQGVGVLCHEMFHSLGAPDLYHYSQDAFAPVGTWDIMESNTNPPQSMGAYMKYRYGNWIDNIPEITENGTYTLHPLTSSENNCYKIASPNANPNNEYFVLEYRKKEGTFEGNIPSSGLVIYRINPALNGQGNSSGPPDEVYIYRPYGDLSNNGEIVQAAFKANIGRTEFNNLTNPNCFLSDGSLAGLQISQISSTGSTISFHVDIPTMTYSSSIVKQNYSDVLPGTTNQQVLCLEVVTSGSDNPLHIHNIGFSTFGTTNTEDIQNARLYCTFGDKFFNTNNQYGSTVDNPNGAYYFSGNLPLSSGYTYFWLTYDVKNTAVEGDFIDALCMGSTINGVNHNPTDLNPSGARKISTKYASLPYSQDFEMQWENLLSTRDIPDIHWQNTPATGDNSWRRQDDGISAGWLTSSGHVTPNGSGGAANFHSWDALNKSTGILDVFLNCSAPGTKVMKFDFQNEEGYDSLYVYFSHNNGATWDLKAAYRNALWQTNTITLDTTTSDSCILRFKAVSDYGATDIGIDNLVVSNTIIPNFTASATEIFQTQSVSFTDISVPDASTWSWSFPGGTPSVSTEKNPQNITYNNPGVYDVVLNVTSDVGAETLTKHAFIHVIPILNAGVDRKIVCGGSVRLEPELIFNPTGDEFTYSWTPVAGLNNPNVMHPIASPSFTTDYVCSITDGLITSKDTVKIQVVNELLVDVGSNIEINCNDEAEISALTNHTRGSFIKLNGADFKLYNCTQASFGKSLITSYANGDLKYTQDISGNYNGCAGYAPNTFNGKIAVIDRGTCSFMIKANNAQAAGAKGLIIVNNTGNNETIAMSGSLLDTLKFPCVMIGRMDGDSLKSRITQFGNINASMGYDGPSLQFSWNPNYNISSVAVPRPVVNPKTTTLYTINVSDGNCSSTDNMKIVILQPEVSLGNDTAFCNGSSIMYDLTGTGTGYQWNDMSQEPIHVVNTEGSYSVTVYNSDGCFNSDTVYVEMFEMPEKPVVTQNENTLISSSETGNQWYDSDGIIEGAVNQTFEPQQDGYYYVIVTNPDGCISLPSESFYFNLTGESEFQNTTILLVPNPATDEIRINTENRNTSTVKIYSPDGKLIKRIMNYSSEMPVSIAILEKGIYICTVQTDEVLYTIRFVKY